MHEAAQAKASIALAKSPRVRNGLSEKPGRIGIVMLRVSREADIVDTRKAHPVKGVNEVRLRARSTAEFGSQCTERGGTASASG